MIFPIFFNLSLNFAIRLFAQRPSRLWNRFIFGFCNESLLIYSSVFISYFTVFCFSKKHVYYTFEFFNYKNNSLFLSHDFGIEIVSYSFTGKKNLNSSVLFFVLGVHCFAPKLFK